MAKNDEYLGHNKRHILINDDSFAVYFSTARQAVKDPFCISITKGHAFIAHRYNTDVTFY